MDQQTGGLYTSSQYFRATGILCLALVAGITFFSVIVLFIFFTGNIEHAIPEQAKTLTIVAASTALVCMLAGNSLFKKRILAAKELPRLSEKLNAYRAAIILRYGLLEVPGLFSVIAFFLTGETRIFIVTGAEVLLMLLLVPNRQRVIKDLELSSQEAGIINDPNRIIE